MLGRNNKALIMAILIMSTLLSACQTEELEPAAERAMSVAVTETITGRLEVQTTLTGQIYPLEEVRLTPKMPGTVERVYGAVGDAVTAGQVLLSLEQRDLNNSIRQAEAALNTARAGLAAAEEQQLQAQRELERIQILHDQGAATTQQLEQAQMAASEAPLASTRAQVNQAQVSLEVARSSLADTQIRSPITGVITEINATAGEIISSQIPAVTVMQLNPIKVKTQVAEYLVNQFSSGQEVVVRIPAAADIPYSGTVDTLAPAPAAGSMTYPMEVVIDNQSGLIKVGMFAEVRLITETRENVLLVPSESIVVREGRTVVFIAEEQRVRIQEVHVGIDNGQQVEITEGLSPGQQVVYRGQDFLEDGGLITIVTGSDAP